MSAQGSGPGSPAYPGSDDESELGELAELEEDPDQVVPGMAPADFQRRERWRHGWSVFLSIVLCLALLALLGWAGTKVVAHFSHRSQPQDDRAYQSALTAANQGRARLRKVLDATAQPVSILMASLSSSAEVQQLSQTWNSGQDLFNHPPHAFTGTPTADDQVAGFVSGLTGYVKSLDNVAYSLSQQVKTAGQSRAAAMVSTATNLLGVSVQQAQLVLNVYEAQAGRLCLVDQVTAQGAATGAGGDSADGSGTGSADSGSGSVGSDSGATGNSRRSPGCSSKASSQAGGGTAGNQAGGQSGGGQTSTGDSGQTGQLSAGSIPFNLTLADRVKTALASANALLQGASGLSPANDVSLANRMTTASQKLDSAVDSLQKALDALPAAPRSPAPSQPSPTHP